MKKLHMTEETAYRILELIPATRRDAVSVKELCDLTGYSHRTVKDAVHYLRAKYPICAQEKDGGGYWLAETDSEILDFIQTMNRRIKTYAVTIDNMTNRFEEMQRKSKEHQDGI